LAKTDSFADDDDIVSGINVTPLVDVCLVLVIIFMVTAPMLSEPVIKVELPKAHTKEGEERDKITITLGKDGRLALDYKEYATYAAMEPDLKLALATSESKLVILKADENAWHGRLVDLMAKAKDAGAQSLTIATERKKGG
jgi:biopolymer transport protein ExbD